MRKKLLSILLAMVMVLGLLPTVAFASVGELTDLSITIKTPTEGKNFDVSPVAVYSPQGSMEIEEVVWYKISANDYEAGTENVWETVSEGEVAKMEYLYMPLIKINIAQDSYVAQNAELEFNGTKFSRRGDSGELGYEIIGPTQDMYVYGPAYKPNHSGTAVWTQTATTHEQKWNCCNAVVVASEPHEWENGKCGECSYTCLHSGGTATCTAKAVCDVCGEEYGDLASHKLTHLDAKEASAAETGNVEYWHCDVCDKYFSDENGTNEIASADTVISKLAPKIMAGDGATVTEGEKKALSFTSDAAFEDFICVEVDGKTVNESSYTVKSGSTVVTLNVDYVATLAVGEHTLGIVSESGTATAKFTVNKKAEETTGKADKPDINDKTPSPKTGDSSNLALWISLLFVSGGAVIGTTVVSRKKKYNS